MSEWVAVVQEEGDEPIEIPTESDGTILLTSLTAQFPGVTGLKFRNPDTNALRGVRCSENQLFPPPNADDETACWGQHTYICTRPNLPSASNIKRKSELKNSPVKKFSRITAPDVCSRILRFDGLPYKMSPRELEDWIDELAEITPHKVHFISNRQGQAAGDAYVTFDDKNEAKTVIDHCDQKNIGNSNRYVKIYEADEEELEWQLHRQDFFKSK